MKRSRWVAFTSVVGSLVLLGSCGGGQKIPPFNATPTVTGLFPSNITAGSDGFILSVAGTGFMSNSQGVTFVNWNGSPRSTSFDVTTGQLAVQIFASDITTANSVTITATNPAPGGGTSPVSFASKFTIEPPQAGLTIASPLDPVSAKAGSAAFTLTDHRNRLCRERHRHLERKPARDDNRADDSDDGQRPDYARRRRQRRLGERRRRHPRPRDCHALSQFSDHGLGQPGANCIFAFSVERGQWRRRFSDEGERLGLRPDFFCRVERRLPRDGIHQLFAARRVDSRGGYRSHGWSNNQATVAVTNPAPGGGTSSTVTFTIN